MNDFQIPLLQAIIIAFLLSTLLNYIEDLVENIFGDHRCSKGISRFYIDTR